MTRVAGWVNGRRPARMVMLLHVMLIHRTPVAQLILLSAALVPLYAVGMASSVKEPAHAAILVKSVAAKLAASMDRSVVDQTAVVQGSPAQLPTPAFLLLAIPRHLHLRLHRAPNLHPPTLVRPQSTRRQRKATLTDTTQATPLPPTAASPSHRRAPLTAPPLLQSPRHPTTRTPESSVESSAHSAWSWSWSPLGCSGERDMRSSSMPKLALSQRGIPTHLSPSPLPLQPNTPPPPPQLLLPTLPPPHPLRPAPR